MASKSNQQVSDKHWYKASWQIGNGSLRAFLGVTNMNALGETFRSERAIQSLIQLSVRLCCDSAEDVFVRNYRQHEL